MGSQFFSNLQGKLKQSQEENSRREQHIKELDLELQGVRGTWASPDVHQRVKDLYQETLTAQQALEVRRILVKEILIFWNNYVDDDVDDDDDDSQHIFSAIYL